MEQPVIKILNKYYSKDNDIRNLMAYIAGEGREKDKQKVVYISAAGLKRKYEKAGVQIIKTQKAFGKNQGRRVYHMIVSFPEEVKDLQYVKHSAKAVAAEIFKRHQVFYGIHASTENLHIHFAINAVSYIDGRKWHMNKTEFEGFREYLIQLLNSILKEEFCRNNR